MWRETLFCVILTFGAALVAYLLIRGDPSWFYSIIPAGLAGGRDPAASAEFLRSTLYDPQKDWLGVFATFLFTHNSPDRDFRLRARLRLRRADAAAHHLQRLDARRFPRRVLRPRGLA